ncbi:MAG: hypothetical protein IPL20_15515 [Saprospiraceae bacterium]|nr:hypothetical protein [Saprospiraceae bacterium]
MKKRMNSFALLLYQYYFENGEDPNNLSSDLIWVHFRYAWWDINTFEKISFVSVWWHML